MMALAGRLICLALISAGLGTASLATLQPASAAGVDAPTAVAVAPSGASYVGFASGGRLLELDVRGRRIGAVPLDQDDPVSGLSVTSSGQIWVDYGSSVSLLGPGGRVLRHFDGAGGSCTGSPATRYGGLTVGGGKVWVANRCAGTMSVYGLGGRLLATVDLPGSDHPRGITYGAAQSGRGATVYVALPDAGRIAAYRADRVRDSMRPWRVVGVRRPAGGVRPRPSGIAVDQMGQLTVTDLANNAVFLLDTNHDFNVYRTLGHPPRASRAAGRLDAPSALAQYPQDRGQLSGNLFIADSGNRRVQRWNTSGWTYWATTVRAGRGTGGSGSDLGDDDPGGPTSSTAPSISGSATVGATVTCNPGAWYGAGGPAAGTIRYAYGWQRGGTTIAGATSSTYVVTATDAGTSLTCVVTATNSFGSTTRSSAAVVVVGGSLVAPVLVTAPSITGTPTVGETLTCDAGTWSGTGITYTRRWRRDGLTILGATATTYATVPADADTELSCVVTATNAGGTTDATSAPVTVRAARVGRPINTEPPAVTGVEAVGTALTCAPGSWSGGSAPFAYAWWRDGVPIADTASSKYVVLNADVGARLGCTVTVTSPAGSTSASSPGRTVVTPSDRAPLNLTPPTVSGNPVAGQALTCDPGAWSGDPTAVIPLWQRDGVTVANGAWTYLVGSDDADATIRCLVVARNGSGSGAARSAPAAADACVGPVGVEINGGAASTSSSFVSLALRAPRGATTVHLSNTPGFEHETVAVVPAGCTYDWVLPSIPGLALTWTVYVRYDGSGTTYTDSILVDPPS
ncbi:hypothetical protein [Nocardioides conyzicola]|uniref:Ig-like domain-containing protein n=1 Tax=Nocardioides conyzicola TaxID=1651781 RepID=A0ABP8XM60_9ACTN